MRRAPRRDQNEREIVNALRAAGATVAQLDGQDIPDLLVGRNGTNLLLEVKPAPGPGVHRRQTALRPGQRAWHLEWGGQVATVRTVAEALAVLQNHT